jgi:hypothetical protein
MNTYGGMGGVAPSFMTSALEGGEWSPSRPGLFNPAEKAPSPSSHWAAGSVGPRAGVDTVEKGKFWH